MTVKKPQDHMQKKPSNGTVVVQGVKISIPEDRFKDWDVVEGVATMQDADTSEPQKLVASVRVMKALLGDDYNRVKTELRAVNDGVLTADTMGTFLTEAFDQLNPNS